MKIQLKRAEVQKNKIIKNIYKEYEIYFTIVREFILSSAKKGILDIYSDLSIADSNCSLNKGEIFNFLNNNISYLINSKLPLLTIEQLKLGDISDPKNLQLNEKSLKELLEIKEYQEAGFYDENQLISTQSFQFNCDINSNSYEYYEIPSEDESLSLNLDKNIYIDACSKKYNFKNINYEKNIPDSVLQTIDETKSNKLNYDNEVNDLSISTNNLKFFQNIDKSFSHLLLKLSYNINLELFKINLIKKTLSEDTFKILSNINKDNIIQYPHPFVIKYILAPKKLSNHSNKYSDIFLFNMSYIELEFNNLELSICRNNINELKNRFRLINKKQLYWKNKELSL